MKKVILFIAIGLLGACIFLAACKRSPAPVTKLSVTVNSNHIHSIVDGFGVNITPAQWHGGNLKPVIDDLVDDLGAVLFRFDCTGLANWLDPALRGPDGSWPEPYLDSIYRTRVFTDAWETFRYINSKGIEPFFNVSGRIHPGLGFPEDPFRLADFEGYTEMIATMLHWARYKENLKFSLLAPFNETDLGYPEGPAMDAGSMLLCTKAMVSALDRHGLSDIKLIAIDDANPRLDKLEAVLSDTSLVKHIAVFATHTYGNGDIGENEPWYKEETAYTRFSNEIRKSPFKKASVWMSEYGDLDQTGLIEYEFAWRSTRRLMKGLRDDFNAAIAWDAFDNFHAHDTAWAVYGLLKTDTVNWTYMPKKRYYAAKNIYRYVRPGWKKVEVSVPEPEKFDVYKTWHDPFRNLFIQAFVSPEGNDFSVVFLNNIEQEVEITMALNGFRISGDGLMHYFVTDSKRDCEMTERAEIQSDTIKVILIPNSISTLTTLP